MNDPEKKRGFAAMDPARRREIASQGGRAAQASGTAHSFTPEEGRAAGEKRRIQPETAEKLLIVMNLVEHVLDDLRVPPQVRVTVYGSLYIASLIEARRLTDSDTVAAIDRMIAKLQSYRDAPDAETMAQVAVDTADSTVAH